MTRTMTFIMCGVVSGSVLASPVPKRTLSATFLAQDKGNGLDASDMMALAQEWLGGTQQVAEIQSFEFESDGEKHRVLLPDRYQVESATPAGKRVTAFDGRSFWERPERPVRPTAFSRPAPSEAVIQAQGRQVVSLYALRYLVRMVPTYPMSRRVVSTAECARLQGVCLEFRAQSAVFHLSLNQETGQPHALISQTTYPQGLQLVIDMPRDYQDVDGIKVPFTTLRRTIQPDGQTRENTPRRLQSFRWNPSIVAADFVAPPTGR